MKSTVCLNMIVKNESHIIIKTLENLCNYIQFSYWVISDTGSTDNTKELITDFFKDRQINGEIVEHEWVDFGYNRTKALECAYNKTDFLFIFDADDEIVGDFVLPHVYDCDRYTCKFGTDFVYYRPLLINNRKKWGFKGVLHEFLVNIDEVQGGKNIEGNYHLVSGRSGNRSKNPNKYRDDAIILKKAHFDESATDYSLSCRYAFYCAQSYKDAGLEYIDDAIEWYKKCLDLKMCGQEKYHSCLTIGDLYMKKNENENALKYWYKTIEYDEERIEGIINAINHLRNSGQHLLVNALYYRFKNYKSNLQNKLFLFKAMYNNQLEYNNSISAYYVSDKMSGYECSKIIFINKILPYNLLKLTVSNFKFYIDFIDKDKNEGVLQLFYAFDEVMDMISLKNEQIDDNMVTIWNKLFEKSRPLLTKFYYYSFKNKPIPQIFISFTTCKRLDLFKETIYSMLNHWLDINKIDYWFCVDDNSSNEDRLEMKSRFPWINYYMKSCQEKGHRHSMNIIWNKLNELKPTYWIHMEDDFLFYNKMNYIGEAINALNELNDLNVKQILFNRNYGETIQNYNSRGHVNIDNNNKINNKFVLHNHSTAKFNYSNCHYWPHYSFRPSLIDVKVILELGNYDSPNNFFEMDYAKRWTDASFKSAFFNIITNRHIGRLTSDRNTKVVKNAYDLNNENQFNIFETNNDFIISLTSIPRRFTTSLPIVLKSIQKQSMKCKIILNIPHEYSKWDMVELPDEIKNNKDIILNRTIIDYGPATKLLGAIDYINKMNLSIKYVITIDDDIEYIDSDYFQNIKQTVAKYPDHVISIASINLSHYPYSYENGLSYDNLGYVDIPRGYCGVSYPIYLFKTSTYLSREFFNTLPSGIFNEDDAYFGILMGILNIPIFVENNKKNIKVIECAGMSGVCEKTTVDRITNEMNIIQFAVNKGYLPNKIRNQNI